MASSLSLILLFCILNPSLVVLISSASFNESCTTGAPPCQALLAYRISDATESSLANISALFSVTAQDILSANGFSPDADLSTQLSDETVRIMLPCPCVRNLRTGAGVITYTVVKDDGLFAIAQKFGSFVTFQEIATANGVADPDKILMGQNLTIPYPCACQGNMFSGRNVLFMSYVVQKGETSATLSRQYGISVSELERLNAPVALAPEAVIKLPVQSCKASFNKDATDANLTVPAGGYVTTANGCVQCSCMNGSQMFCTKSPSAPSSCSLKCKSSSLEIGKFNTSEQGGRCIVDSCLYDGYRSNNIFTRIEKNTTDVDCQDAGAPPPFAYAPEEQPATGGIGISPTAGGTFPPQPNTPTTTGAPPPASGSTRTHVQAFMLLLLIMLPLTWI